MNMYIWFKEGTDLTTLKLQGISSLNNQHYLHISDMEITPFPSIPQDSIECITIRTSIEGASNFRAEGIYRHEGAELVVKTDWNKKYFQALFITAPSVDIARKILTLVRQGKLAPNENWSGLEQWKKKGWFRSSSIFSGFQALRRRAMTLVHHRS